MIILADTRQQKDKYITDKFDKANILWLRTKLDSADYMAIRYDDKKGFYKDYTILIDTKKDLLEMAGNLCKKSEHERLKREIVLAKELGCEKFVFLIKEKGIKTPQDLKNWRSQHTKVKGETLYKIMATMKERYGVEFIITERKNMGKKVIDLLTANNEITKNGKEGNYDL